MSFKKRAKSLPISSCDPYELLQYLQGEEWILPLNPTHGYLKSIPCTQEGAKKNETETDPIASGPQCSPSEPEPSPGSILNKLCDLGKVT